MVKTTSSAENNLWIYRKLKDFGTINSFQTELYVNDISGMVE